MTVGHYCTHIMSSYLCNQDKKTHRDQETRGQRPPSLEKFNPKSYFKYLTNPNCLVSGWV